MDLWASAIVQWDTKYNDLLGYWFKRLTHNPKVQRRKHQNSSFDMTQTYFNSVHILKIYLAKDQLKNTRSSTPFLASKWKLWVPRDLYNSLESATQVGDNLM
jgi:hypothetical protein